MFSFQSMLRSAVYQKKITAAIWGYFYIFLVISPRMVACWYPLQKYDINLPGTYEKLQCKTKEWLARSFGFVPSLGTTTDRHRSYYISIRIY